jgi:hypothetical protein
VPRRLQPRIDLIIELQEVAERLRTQTNAIRTNVRIQTTNDDNYPVLAEGLAAGTFSLTGGMSMLGYQGDNIHDAPTVKFMRTTGSTIVQRDTAVDPPLVPIAREFGGQAGQMLAPLHYNGDFCGFIAVHGDANPRDWSVEDQNHLNAAVADVESIVSEAQWFERPQPSEMKHLLVVLSDPAEGREDEYNEWYSGRHIEETLQTPGWTAARRFTLAEEQISDNVPAQRYLALFELSTDTAGEALDALRSHSGSITTSDSISPDDVVGIFTPITDRIESK